jgi:predicted lysophospholipase L1 biosynthesis ABC-type transport system permease subunit
MVARRLRRPNESKLMTPVKDRLEHGGFLLFLAFISIGLMLIVSSFMGALLGAVLGALLFQPLFQKLLAAARDAAIWPRR